MKIVVIDDEEGIRGLVRDVLEIQGHDIIEADNGKTGLATIHSSAPDLIICDINMPEMTGDELFDNLHALDSNLSVIPFIFLSGEANKSEQIKRLNRGADHCFEKPVDMKLLAAYVNSQLSRVTRVSDYMKRNLDKIAGSLPKTIERDFSCDDSLITNTQGYVSVIVSAMHDYISDEESSIASEDIIENQLNFIHYCLNRIEVRGKLVRATNGEDISWTLIFMVVQAQLKGLKMYISDLYVSMPSAKSTINARISSLIDDDIFIKSGDSKDGRRLQIQLTGRFRQELMGHISESMKMAKEAVL